MNVYEENRLLKQILEQIPMEVYFKDEKGRYQYVSNIYKEIQNGNGNDDVIGKTDYDIMPNHEMAERFVQEDKQIMTTGKMMEYDMDFPSEDGDFRKFHLIKKTITLDEGCAKGILVGSFDITEKSKLQEKIIRQKQTDFLTQLYNRDYFYEFCNTIEQNENLRSKLIALFVDVNKLKVMNDVWGHEAGDKMLCYVAKTMKHVFCDEEKCFRIGGDEFVILSFDEEDNVVHKIEKLNQILLEETDFFMPVTIATGYVKRVDVNSMEELINTADEKMYTNKISTREQGHKIFCEYILKELKEQGLIDDKLLQRTNGWLPLFCHNIGMEKDEIQIVEMIVKFYRITEYDFKCYANTSDTNQRILILLRNLLDSSKVVDSIISVNANWDGNDGIHTVSHKEIPYLSRVARCIIEVGKKNELDSVALLEEIKDMAGRELDPELCELMEKFIRSNYNESPRLNLIRCLCKKYHTDYYGLKAIMSEMPFFLFVKDLDSKYQLVSHACDNICKKSHETGWVIYDKTDYEVFNSPKAADYYYEDDKKIIATKQLSKFRTKEIKSDGTEENAFVFKFPILDERDEVIGILGLIIENDYFANLETLEYFL